MRMAHIDTLREIFERKGLTFTEVGKKIGKSSPTVKKKLYSENVNTVVDFLVALGIRLIDDENGIDIVTGEAYKQQIEVKNQIGNLIFNQEEIEKLKKLLE